MILESNGAARLLAAGWCGIEDSTGWKAANWNGAKPRTVQVFEAEATLRGRGIATLVARAEVFRAQLFRTHAFRAHAFRPLAWEARSGHPHPVAQTEPDMASAAIKSTEVMEAGVAIRP